MAERRRRLVTLQVRVTLPAVDSWSVDCRQVGRSFRELHQIGQLVRSKIELEVFPPPRHYYSCVNRLTGADTNLCSCKVFRQSCEIFGRDRNFLSAELFCSAPISFRDIFNCYMGFCEFLTAYFDHHIWHISLINFSFLDFILLGLISFISEART